NGVNYPKIRNWTGADWDSEIEMDNGGSPVQWVRTEYSPTEANLSLTVTLSTDGNLDSWFYDGSDWTFYSNIASVGTTADIYPSFDLAFETSSGDALLVYSTGICTLGTEDELGYLTWSSTSETWSSSTTWETSNNICLDLDMVYQVAMDSHPSSDEIVF
ncbi:unnamed protein product, partial [marine sediment metagenome]